MKVIQLYKSEKKLIARALHNSRRAQKELFDQYSSKMLSVARYYIKDLHEAEDAMVVGFFKAFDKLNTFKNEGNFEGWLRKIVVNECLSILRKKKGVYVTDEIDQISDHVDNDLIEHYNADDIQNLIDELPKGYKEVFLLYAIEGYKHKEISKMLGISIGTSKSQLSKARKVLQQLLLESNNKQFKTSGISLTV